MGSNLPLQSIAMEEPIQFQLREDHITLGQLLKAVDAISSGGEVRAFLHAYTILVNGEVDRRRGRKLRPGDTIELPNGRIVSIC